MLGYHPNLNSADCSAKEHFHVRKSSNSCSSFSLDRLVFGAFGTLTLLIVVLVFVICCADLKFRANQHRRLGLFTSCVQCDGQGKEGVWPSDDSDWGVPSERVWKTCEACNGSGTVFVPVTEAEKEFEKAKGYFKERMTEQIQRREINLEDEQEFVTYAVANIKNVFLRDNLGLSDKESFWNRSTKWFNKGLDNAVAAQKAKQEQLIAADKGAIDQN